VERNFLEGVENSMKRAIAAIILIFVVGCAANIPPDAKPAYTANEVLIRVNELQKTTIELYDNKGITPERAQLIVTWCVNSAKTLREVPAGWGATIVATWKNLVSKIKVPEGPISTIWSIVDTLIGRLG
jgi:hypothetical protein